MISWAAGANAVRSKHDTKYKASGQACSLPVNSTCWKWWTTVCHLLLIMLLRVIKVCIQDQYMMFHEICSVAKWVTNYHTWSHGQGNDQWCTLGEAAAEWSYSVLRQGFRPHTYNPSLPKTDFIRWLWDVRSPRSDMKKKKKKSIARSWL